MGVKLTIPVQRVVRATTRDQCAQSTPATAVPKRRSRLPLAALTDRPVKNRQQAWFLSAHIQRNHSTTSESASDMMISMASFASCITPAATETKVAKGLGGEIARPKRRRSESMILKSLARMDPKLRESGGVTTSLLSLGDLRGKQSAQQCWPRVRVIITAPRPAELRNEFVGEHSARMSESIHHSEDEAEGVGNVFLTE